MSSHETRSGSVPIGGGSTFDPFYRYQMPALICRQRHSNKKVAIVNMPQVARALNRPPEEVVKYLGQVLSSNGSYSAKTREYLVGGTYTTATLQQKLLDYCEAFVVCGLCRNPETEYRVRRNAVFLKCLACGGKTEVDGELKLCKYIATQYAAGRFPARGRRNATGPSQEENPGHLNQQLASAPIDSSEHGDVDEEGAIQLAVDATRHFLDVHADFSDSQLVELISHQQIASTLKSHVKLIILVRAAFTKNVFKDKEVAKYAPALRGIINGNKILERHLIAALEALCVEKPKHFAVMLKQCYDEDVLDEETILVWAREGRSDYTLDTVDEEACAVLREEAEPVVRWLEEAESEDESSDEE